MPVPVPVPVPVVAEFLSMVLVFGRTLGYGVPTCAVLCCAVLCCAGLF